MTGRLKTATYILYRYVDSYPVRMTLGELRVLLTEADEFSVMWDEIMSYMIDKAGAENVTEKSPSDPFPFTLQVDRAALEPFDIKDIADEIKSLVQMISGEGKLKWLSGEYAWIKGDAFVVNLSTGLRDGKLNVYMRTDPGEVNHISMDA